MNKRFMAGLVCLLALTAQPANIVFNLADFQLTGLAYRKVVLTPLSMPTHTGSSTVTKDERAQISSATGQVVFTNVVAGSYRVTVTGPNALTPFIITVTNTSATLDGGDLIVSIPDAAGQGIFVRIHNGYASNLVVTNLTIPAGAVADYVLTSDAAGKASWQPATAAGGGGLIATVNTNQFAMSPATRLNIKDGSLQTNNFFWGTVSNLGNVYFNNWTRFNGPMTNLQALYVEDSVFVSDVLQTAGFKMPTGAAADYVLTSDGTGVGTWRPGTASAGTPWTNNTANNSSVVYLSLYPTNLQIRALATNGAVLTIGPYSASWFDTAFGDAKSYYSILSARDFSRGDSDRNNFWFSAGMNAAGSVYGSIDGSTRTNYAVLTVEAVGQTNIHPTRRVQGGYDGSITFLTVIGESGSTEIFDGALRASTGITNNGIYQHTNGAVDGHVFTSDAIGNATWRQPLTRMTNALLSAGPTNGSVGAKILTAGTGITLTTVNGTNLQISATNSGIATNAIAMAAGFGTNTSLYFPTSYFQTLIPPTTNGLAVQILQPTGQYSNLVEIISSNGTQVLSINNTGGVSVSQFLVRNQFEVTGGLITNHVPAYNRTNVFTLGTNTQNYFAMATGAADGRVLVSTNGGVGMWMPIAGGAGATNAILMAAGFGTNTTLRYPMLYSPTNFFPTIGPTNHFYLNAVDFGTGETEPALYINDMPIFIARQDGAVKALYWGEGDGIPGMFRIQSMIFRVAGAESGNNNAKYEFLANEASGSGGGGVTLFMHTNEFIQAAFVTPLLSSVYFASITNNTLIIGSGGFPGAGNLLPMHLRAGSIHSMSNHFFFGPSNYFASNTLQHGTHTTRRLAVTQGAALTNVALSAATNFFPTIGPTNHLWLSSIDFGAGETEPALYINDMPILSSRQDAATKAIYWGQADGSSDTRVKVLIFQVAGADDGNSDAKVQFFANSAGQASSGFTLFMPTNEYVHLDAVTPALGSVGVAGVRSNTLVFGSGFGGANLPIVTLGLTISNATTTVSHQSNVVTFGTNTVKWLNITEGVKGLTSYLYLKGFDNVTGATVPNTSDISLPTFMKVLFSNSADEAANYAEWQVQVPDDLDTAVPLRAKVIFKLNGADTGTHRYVLSMASVADSAAYSGTVGNAVNLDFAGDGLGGNGDVEKVGFVTLTGWAAAVTPGNHWVVRLARDGNAAQDASTVDSMLSQVTIEYGVSQ